MTYVSFPGLFGGTIEINPVAFSVLGISVHWYGLIICTGIILAVMMAIKCAHREGISTDDVLDYALYAVPIAIIGARLYYVITSNSSYDSFYEVIAIWNGGLAIYGGVIAGALTVLIVSLVKKIHFLKIGDAACTALFVGQAIGRWGNFCNGEAYGHLDRIELLGNVIRTPSLSDGFFLRMAVKSDATNGQLLTVHPTFLYESVWNIIGLVIALVLYRKKKFDGQIVLFYLAWYGLGRFFIEGLRADSLMLGNTGIRISQLLSLLTFIFALCAFIVITVRKNMKKCEDGAYEPQFSASNESEDSEDGEILGDTDTDSGSNDTKDKNVSENTTEE